MKQRDYDTKFGFHWKKDDLWIVRQMRNYSVVFTANGFQKSLYRRIPMVRWLPKYQKSNLLSDILAGITVGIYNVPQAMSYSTLAGLPPVYGLYSSFFPPILYSMFGIAYHSSIGVSSLLALMINKCILKLRTLEDYGVDDISDVEVASSLCLLSGLVQTLMAVFRCDKMMKFLSAPAISAITLASCFFGIFMLLPKMLGVTFKPTNARWFNLFYTIRATYENLDKMNYVTCAISAATFAFLIIMKIHVEPRLKQTKLGSKVPFPTELITIVTNTFLSYYFDFKQKYGVKIINEIPRGFPMPAIPRIEIWPEILMDAIPIAIVSYTLTMSMGQIFSKKHKFRLDSNQELLALGFVNTGSSFFSCFTTTASLSRTLLNESCGAKSHISGVFSALCILFVITCIGPLLATLPMCVLSTIVVVAIRSLFSKFGDFHKLWLYSKHDFWVMLLTSLVTLFSGIAEGVASGMIFAIITIAIQSQQPSIKQLGQVRNNDYQSMNHYYKAKKPSHKIVRFDAALIFANVDKFLDNVRETARQLRQEENARQQWTVIILDCHTWNYTDSMGIDAVKEIDEDLKAIKVLLLFASLKSSLRRQYHHSGIFHYIHDYQIYPSIQDAMDNADSVLSDMNNPISVEISENTKFI